MKKKSIFVLIAAIFMLASCDVLEEASKTVTVPPTEAEMIAGLKEALEVGSGNASTFLNQPGGYLNNERFKIPFPPDAIKVANKLRELGFGDQVDKFIERMNRGAEDAAKEAKPIFVNAIKEMTLTDAKNILLGADDAATTYFKNKTSTALYNAFSPKIKASLDKYEVTKYWTQLTTTYNSLPLVKPVETDLVKYATNKALDGLFLKVSEEEKDIRHNFSARVTDLLQRVFGWADTQK